MILPHAMVRYCGGENNNNNMFISYSWYTIHIKGCNRANAGNKIINEKTKKLTLTVSISHVNGTETGSIASLYHVTKLVCQRSTRP